MITPQKFNVSCDFPCGPVKADGTRRRCSSGFEWWAGGQTAAAPLPFVGDGSGYVRDVLPDEPREGRDTPQLDRNRMQETLDELRAFLWLDERTRAMVVSFSIYNANFNLYAACNFIFMCAEAASPGQL